MASNGETGVEFKIDNTKKILGRGGFSTVFEGSRLPDATPVAIKRMAHMDNYNDREFVPLTRNLQHENIVCYFKKWEDSNFFYIAMELCAGNLEQLIGGKYEGPSPGTVPEMMLQVAYGLQYLHSQNPIILHRDLKPTNVLISIPKGNEKPKMKLADFGFCKETQEGSSNSLSYSGVGTEGWRAPECYSTGRDGEVRQKTCTKFSDIFSLGCVYGFAFSGGFHPFGNVSYLRTANIVTGSLVEANLLKITDESLRSMIRKMISENEQDRPGLDVIMAHPTFGAAETSRNEPSNK